MFLLKINAQEVSKEHTKVCGGDFTIECQDGTFHVPEWCLYRSDFLMQSIKEMIQLVLIF